MEKILYLMRHGQTLFNLEHKIQGWCDSPLTELGINQAKIAGRYFTDNKLKLDHCYSSTSERACDTLELVTGGKLPYTRLKGIKEWNFGCFEAMDDFLNPPLPYDDFFVKYGGESQDGVSERMAKTLSQVMEQEDHHFVLAVSHGGAMACFLRYYKQTLPHGIKNCTILRLKYEDGQFTLLDYFEPDFSELEK
ncbi:histidine phosphatase family protein [Lactobacillus delbrueckii subsp. lactis]|uniref:histidine phosphatase family protein n=1 Tax=Lactobacillus delbrueckii TaxID=1584 RepID=UPI0004AC36B0|nr:histidine phosphatase family protein [Lactobacillus delbrueckii]MCD5507023.1 histidine phosphatase family protein [Lactobacillus delbrueckii subsp. lactis]MCD5514729.1 histidine phosphatase family protein [Lactobacillus delbrueckii subsp. lactis]MCD5520242.1 histidine phosphatase family protein [Lactobacillus delbrueckii subsp. lactis]MCD5524107.1 histidine phosphatase family protein [Lactobacillus delbrueckii subsp. lactis]MCD5526008.1 histidine phosphatase family protein [Lactobacillus de